MDTSSSESDDAPHINTGGGAFVGQSVNTGGGTFIGGGVNITNNYHQVPVPSPAIPLSASPPKLGPVMIMIPTGDFLMGSENLPEESPLHRVKLATFAISKYPITNIQYAEFVRETGHQVTHDSRWTLSEISSLPPSDRKDHPIVGITWDDAVKYCLWLCKQTGRSYRLPTEAEWEKAARGSDGRRFPWGNQKPNSHLLNYEESALCDTTPVGHYPEGTSPYGVMDMAGNVSEWTNTRWGYQLGKPDYPYPYQNDGRERTDLDTYPHREYRVCRGGSYGSKQEQVTCTARARYRANSRDSSHGFRVVLTL